MFLFTYKHTLITPYLTNKRNTKYLHGVVAADNEVFTAPVQDDCNMFVSSPNYNLIITDSDQISTSLQFWLNCFVKFIWKAGNKWNIRGSEGEETVMEPMTKCSH